MEKQNKKNGTFGRLLRYIYKNYRVYMITVIICIIIAAAASVVQTVFLQRLIDTCILPGLENGFESIRQPFIQTILSMVTLYVFGVAAAFTYTHLMATVTQGTLKHLRVDMFDKMQSLPIKYFDTHAHGDIMSTYTNDTDAIRQLIGQSLPMVFQSSLTITVMFLMMIYYSVWMTIIVCRFLRSHADRHEEIRRRKLPLHDGTAEISCQRRGLYRRDDPGTEGRKSLLPRGRMSKKISTN